jgi:hypothetical protein
MAGGGGRFTPRRERVTNVSFLAGVGEAVGQAGVQTRGSAA